MNYIIDPVSSNKYSIFSSNGKNLLKKYINYIQIGGLSEQAMDTIMKTFEGKIRHILVVQVRSDENYGRDGIQGVYSSKIKSDKNGLLKHTKRVVKVLKSAGEQEVNFRKKLRLRKLEAGDEAEFKRVIRLIKPLYDSEWNGQIIPHNKMTFDEATKLRDLLAKYGFYDNIRTINKFLEEAEGGGGGGGASAEAERQRQARARAEAEAERQRQAREAAAEAERQRQAREAAAEAERQRQAREAAAEAERQRQAREAAAEAEAEAERQRHAREAAEQNCNQITDSLVNLDQFQNRVLSDRQIETYKNMVNRLVNFYKKCLKENDMAAKGYEIDIKNEINKYETNQYVIKYKNKRAAAAAADAAGGGGSAYPEHTPGRTENPYGTGDGSAYPKYTPGRTENPYGTGDAGGGGDGSAYPKYTPGRTENPYGTGDAGGGGSAYPKYTPGRTENPYGTGDAGGGGSAYPKYTPGRTENPYGTGDAGGEGDKEDPVRAAAAPTKNVLKYTLDKLTKLKNDENLEQNLRTVADNLSYEDIEPMKQMIINKRNEFREKYHNKEITEEIAKELASKLNTAQRGLAIIKAFKVGF